jgi:methyl-accepting chemotaxis protein
MKNLRLGTKMLVLTLILMASMLVVAYVAVERLGLVNSQIQNIVQQTLAKGELGNEIRINFLSSVRAQKNANLSSDDADCKQFAKASENDLAAANAALTRLKAMINLDKQAGQMEAASELDRALKSFEKINGECLAFAVQNTQPKAKMLLWGDALKYSNALGTLLNAWFDGSVKATEQPETVRLTAIHEAIGALHLINALLPQHIESIDLKEMDRMEKRVDDAFSKIEQSLPVAAGSDNSGLASTRMALSDLRKVTAKVIELSRISSNSLGADLSLKGAKVAVDGVNEQSDKLQALLKDEASRGQTLSAAVYSAARWYIAVATVIGIVLGGVLAWFVTRSVTQPVAQVRDLAQAMAAGDLRRRIELEQADEVGQLAEATDSLASSLTKIVTEIQSVSEGLGGSSGELAGVSNQLLSQSERASLQASNVASAAEQLSSNISTMAAAAEEMSVNVASISSASEEMSMSVGTISSAAEQTSTNVSVVSTAVDEISSSFAGVLKDVREGSQIAGDARRMADSATETIQMLNQSGTEISKVTETIKMIALQTNLLALNATIEATSAGDAGKGFAVVAHEIKELANQSGKAAEDIARKIESVQNDTKQAVEVIKNVSQIIKDINASAERISESVEKQTRAATMISQNVGEANKGVGDIARSIAEVAKAAGDMSRNVAEAARAATDVSRNVGEAAKASGGISSSIHGVSDASRSTNESATKVHNSAEHLDRIGKELRKLVGRFKINTEDTPTA